MSPAWRRPDRATLARVLPFATFMALLALRGWAQTHDGWGLLDPRWLYGITVLVVGAMLWAFRHEYGELSRQTLPSARGLLTAIAVGLAVFACWITLDAPWMRLDAGSIGFAPLAPDGRLQWDLVIVRALGATLLVPVMEELFWRSYLMRWLQQPGFAGLAPQRVGLRAVLLSTFLFVLVHPLWLAAAVAGLAYAWLYVRSGQLWSAVIAHAVTNGVLAVWVVWTGHWQFW